MPVVDGKHYPYTKKGKAAAKKAKKKKKPGHNITKNIGYQGEAPPPTPSPPLPHLGAQFRGLSISIGISKGKGGYTGIPEKNKKNENLHN